MVSLRPGEGMAPASAAVCDMGVRIAAGSPRPGRS